MRGWKAFLLFSFLFLSVIQKGESNEKERKSPTRFLEGKKPCRMTLPMDKSPGNEVNNRTFKNVLF